MKRGFIFCLVFLFLVSGFASSLEISDFNFSNDSVEVLVLDQSEISINSENPSDLIIKKNFTKGQVKDYLDKGLFIEPQRYFSISLVESLDVLNASSAWKLEVSNNLTGLNQGVCIIDTGINYSHSDLIGRNLTQCNLDCIDKSCVEDCSVEDLNGHGTHVTGIVAASGDVVGLAKQSGFIGLKVFPGDSQSGATTLGITNAIQWCVDNSEQYNISVISLSLGSSTLYDSYCDSESFLFNQSISNAFNQNISVVVASGNDANYTHISLPACISKSIPVGDVYDSDVGSRTWSGTCTDSSTAVDKIVCHANRNSLVELFAPGALINSTWYDGGYKNIGGTSMATPFVSASVLILNQFLEERDLSKTPFELEALLNNTGKIIYDSESERNYSRIDIYSALLDLDDISPIVIIDSPENNSVDSSVNQLFRCNVSDWQLDSVSLNIWNTSGLYYNETRYVSGVENVSEFSVSLDRGSYTWNCNVSDSNLNTNESLNFSLFIGEIDVDLSIENNSYTNTNYTEFNCTSYSDSRYELANISFYIYNDSLIYNETKNVTGVENVSEFNYTFLIDGDYIWGCKVVNNISNSSSKNHSISYDSISPKIVLQTPSDGYSSSSGSVLFEFDINEINIDSCLLVIEDNYSISSNGSISQSVSLADGSYTWYVNCSDLAGNTNTSEQRSLSISSPVISVDLGGGGGSGGTSVIDNGEVFDLSQSQTSSGITKEIEKKDEIKFSIFDKEQQNHTIKINNITNDMLNLTIYSEPIIVVLGIGQSIKLNLTSPDYFDLYLELVSIIDSKANLTIQTIYEPIQTRHEEQIEKQEEKDEEKKDYLKEILLVILGLFVVFIIYYLKTSEKIKKLKKKLRRKNDKTKKVKTKTKSKR